MFIGHASSWNLLLAEFRNGRLPPTYLFYGIPGIGKKLVAYAFVQRIFCHETESGAFACGQCPACQRIRMNRHPDFHFLAPEKDSVKIDQIRDVLKNLNKAPLEAPLKVVMIDEAEKMTLGASNSLLKTLEEPRPQTLFILIATNLFRLLPTIRSRCRKLFFNSPETCESSSYLANQGMEGNREELLTMLDGSLGLALSFASSDLREDLEVIDTAMARRKNSLADILKLSKKWADSDADLDLFLELVKKRIYTNFTETRNDACIPHIDRISQAQKDLTRNVNTQLVLENMLMSLNS